MPAFGILLLAYSKLVGTPCTYYQNTLFYDVCLLLHTVFATIFHRTVKTYDGKCRVIHQNAGRLIEAERFPLVDQNQKGGQ